MSKEITIKLPRPHAGQLEVLSSKARFKILMCGRRWGKSLICKSEAIIRMLKGQHVAYVTPEFGLAGDFFDEIREMLPVGIIRSSNKSTLSIRLHTGGTLKFYSGIALSRFKGKRFHLVIIDEAAHIPDLKNGWLNSIRPTLTDFRGEAIFISTPNSRDYFNSLYEKGLDPNETQYSSFRFTSYQNPFLPDGEVDEARTQLPSIVFDQEYLSIPMSSQSCPFTNIHSNVITTLSSKPVVVYGIDLAKYNDYSVVVGLDETGSLAYFDRFQLGWVDTLARLKNTLDNKVLKVVDRTGVGDVLVEQMQNSLKNVEGFLFTATSKNTIIFELIKDVEIGNVKYNLVTANEMESFSFKRNATTGHLSFNAKSGYHDDCIAALAMANHHRKFVKANANWRLYKV